MLSHQRRTADTFFRNLPPLSINNDQNSTQIEKNNNKNKSNKNKSNKNNHDPHRLTKYKTLYQSEQLHPILVIIPVMTKATS